MTLGPLEGLDAPYVLLENRLDSRLPAKLYRNPVKTILCEDAGGVDACFAQIEAGLADGLHAAGLVSYELGYALEPRLASLMPVDRSVPLAWVRSIRSA